MNYLTEAEIEAIQHLDRSAPYVIGHVSQTQLSVARRFGGCEFKGHGYCYIPETDELIRDDVLNFVAKLRKGKPIPEQKSQELF
jgi:hypothetical protein